MVSVGVVSIGVGAVVRWWVRGLVSGGAVGGIMMISVFDDAAGATGASGAIDVLSGRLEPGLATDPLGLDDDGVARLFLPRTALWPRWHRTGSITFETQCLEPGLATEGVRPI